MWLGLLEVGVDTGQVRVFAQGRHQGFTPGQHLLIVRPGHHHFQRLVEGTLAQPRRIHRKGPQAGDLGQLPAQLANNLLLGTVALFPIFQPHDGKRPLRHATETDDGQHPLGFTIFHQGHKHFFHRLGVVGAIFHRRALGRGGRNNEDATVFRGRQLLGQLPKQQRRRQAQQHATYCQRPGACQGPLQAVGIGLIQACQAPLQKIVLPLLFLAAMAMQPTGTQHGRQAQGDDTGDDYRRRQGKTEFTEQPPHVAAHKGNGHEHRHQCQRGCDHGKGHLPGTKIRSHQPRLAFIDTALDVFQHDDGVIHHQADGQDQRQQGQHVDGKIHHPETNKGTDHRHRNSHRRDQSGAQVAKKGKDHRDHQHHGNPQGDQHLANRRPDKQGFIRVDIQMNIRWQALTHRIDFFAHPVRHRHGIGLGLAHNAQPNSRFTVGTQYRIIVLHA